MPRFLILKLQAPLTPAQLDAAEAHVRNDPGMRGYSVLKLLSVPGCDVWRGTDHQGVARIDGRGVDIDARDFEYVLRAFTASGATGEARVLNQRDLPITYYWQNGILTRTPGAFGWGDPTDITAPDEQQS